MKDVAKKSQPSRTLHVVDGESTGGTLRVSRLAQGKDILVWKDALDAGPVPEGLTLRELSRLRSRFWTGGKSKSEFDERDARLLRWREYDEVVLWFGGTLTCQLSLTQLLTWFETRNLGGRRLSLVTAYGGSLRPEQLSAPYQARKPITAKHSEVASRFWAAFTARHPSRLQRLLAADLRHLPALRDAIEEILQQYPSRYDGLSRFERKLLLAIDSMGFATASFAIGSILQRHAVGDVSLCDLLRGFVTAPSPLIAFAEPFGGRIENYEFNRAKLRLTRIGERVLAGEVDHVALNGIDRWIGGVHLQGTKPAWSWDEKRSKIMHS